MEMFVGILKEDLKSILRVSVFFIRRVIRDIVISVSFMFFLVVLVFADEMFDIF